MDFTQEKNGLYVFQKGFNYSEDGPGNRLVYHLAGCTLTCPWCSNPEGLTREKAVFRTIEELLTEAKSCRMMFFDGGGVTLTGGEVGCQWENARLFLCALKESGISTCIETNAALPEVSALFPYCDTVIADCKSPDEDTLLRVTGASLCTVKSNLLCRAKTGKPLLVRVPLIHGFNTTEEAAQGFASLFSLLRQESGSEHLQFELLRYHEFGKTKWETLGKEYRFRDGFVTDAEVALLAAALKARGLSLITT